MLERQEQGAGSRKTGDRKNEGVRGEKERAGSKENGDEERVERVGNV